MGGVINSINTEFESNELVNKYFKMITVPIVILVIIINIVVVFYYSTVWKNEMREKQTEQLYQYRNEFSSAQRNAEILYTWFLKEDVVNRYFMLDDLYELSGMESSILFNNLTQAIVNVSATNTEIENVYLYNSDMNYYIGNTSSGFIEEQSEPEWYKKYNDMRKKDSTVTMVCDEEKIIYFLEVTDLGEKMGMIVFETELPQTVYKNTEAFEIYIAKGNKIVYSTRKEKIGEKIDLKEEYLKNQRGFKNYGKSVVLLDSISDEFMCYSVNNKIYSRSNIIFIVVFIFISIILMSFTCLILSIIFGREVKRLAVSLMSIIENPKEDEYESGYKEINYIVKSIFSKKEGSIDALGKMLAKKMNVLKSSQIIALQTQITPHFLYNTLQSINLVAMSKFKRKNEVSDMIHLFSRILHNSLDTKNYTISLKKEIDYVKDYISLQNYRYPNRVQVIWNIEAETLKLETIKFSMQPIIENALTHGIYLANRKCTLWINAFIKEQELIIEVKNDGLPIDKQKLIQTNSLLKNNEIVIKESKSIGLSNVNQRIKLIFGKEYGVLLSDDNGITTVTITLPKIKEF